MSALSVRCWPGRKAKAPRNSSGTSKRIAFASAVSGTISAMRRMWKLALMPPLCRASMAFEKVERLGAGAAAPQRLAGRGAEPADLLGVRAVALRALDGA